MRAVADELDTGPASLYVYFRAGEELLASVLDELLGSLDLDPPGATPEDRLVALLHDYTETLYDHPPLARAALSARPAEDHMLALLDALLRLLDGCGVATPAAAWLVDLLLQTATATAAEHSTRDARASSDAEDLRLAEAIVDADPAQLPHLAAATSELFTGARERTGWAFRVLIAGAKAEERPRG